MFFNSNLSHVDIEEYLWGILHKFLLLICERTFEELSRECFFFRLLLSIDVNYYGTSPITFNSRQRCNVCLKTFLNI